MLPKKARAAMPTWREGADEISLDTQIGTDRGGRVAGRGLRTGGRRAHKLRGARLPAGDREQAAEGRPGHPEPASAAYSRVGQPFLNPQRGGRHRLPVAVADGSQ